MPTDQRTYLIVGAAGGIGSALSKRLADRGDRLLLAGRDESKLDALAGKIGGETFTVDATSFDEVDDLLQQVGVIDGVVNLCGSIMLKPAHLTTFDDYHKTIALNLTSAFAIVRSSIAALKKNGGSIVLASSAAASIGLTNHEAIAAAKSGVDGLVRAAAATYAGRNIRVNGVAPGLVDTPMASGITSNETALKASASMHALKRIGQPDDVASLIAWLLSDDASWMTGQTIGIDGGLGAVRSRGA